MPLPPGTGDGGYNAAIERVVVPAVENFKPQIIIIASGLDASMMDPLAMMMVTSEGYREMTDTMVALAERVCDGKLVAIHEGGYSSSYVPFCGAAVIEGLLRIDKVGRGPLHRGLPRDRLHRAAAPPGGRDRSGRQARRRAGDEPRRARSRRSPGAARGSARRPASGSPKRGREVAVLDIDEGAAALTAKLAGDGLAIACDVTDSAAVDAALERLEAELGPVDVWVNNAGIAGGEASDNTNPRAEAQLAELAATGEIKTPLEGLVRMSDEDWRRMLSVHLDGTFHGTRAAARSMAARETGAIVNVASICGIEGCTGHPHYSAAKGGILAFTRTVAKELIQQNVRVNAVAPGFVDTQLVGGSLTAAAGRERPAADPAGPARPPGGDRRDDRLPGRRRRQLLRR